MGRHAGRKLLTVVGLYGLSIVVFGLSHVMWLSLLALAVGGGLDMVSVVLRQTILPLTTPDELRGRVNAVEMVFISASNELGAFESGVAAALVGAVPAVVIGGVLTVAIAIGWSRFFPALARVDRLDDLRPSGPALAASCGNSTQATASLLSGEADAAGPPRRCSGSRRRRSRSGAAPAAGCRPGASAVATWTRHPGLALA